MGAHFQTGVKRRDLPKNTAIALRKPFANKLGSATRQMTGSCIARLWNRGGVFLLAIRRASGIFLTVAA